MHGLDNEYLNTAGRIQYLLGLTLTDGFLVLQLAQVNDFVWVEYVNNLAYATYSGNAAFNYGQANAAYALHAIIEQVVYHNI